MQTWRDVGKISQELAVYLVPILAFDALNPRRVLPAEPPSAARVVREIFTSIIVYDILFFIGHMLMHSSPTLWRIHRKHHEFDGRIRARETARLDPIEEMLDFSCSIAAVNLLKCHPLSRALYDVTIVYLLNEIHSGYSFPFALENLFPFGLWKGARAHCVHHYDRTRNFQKFFGPLDALENRIRPFLLRAGNKED